MCAVGLHIARSYQRALPPIFSFRVILKAKTHGEDKNQPWKKNWFLEFSSVILMAVNRFLRLSNRIKMSVRFKFWQNPMKNMVETEFWIFLLVEILSPEKKIASKYLKKLPPLPLPLKNCNSTIHTGKKTSFDMKRPASPLTSLPTPPSSPPPPLPSQFSGKSTSLDIENRKKW